MGVLQGSLYRLGLRHWVGDRSAFRNFRDSSWNASTLHQLEPIAPAVLVHPERELGTGHGFVFTEKEREVLIASESNDQVVAAFPVERLTFSVGYRQSDLSADGRTWIRGNVSRVMAMRLAGPGTKNAAPLDGLRYLNCAISTSGYENTGTSRQWIDVRTSACFHVLRLKTICVPLKKRLIRKIQRSRFAEDPMRALIEVAQHVDVIMQTFEKMDASTINELCERMKDAHDIKSVRKVLGVRKWHATVSGTSPYDWRNYAISRLLWTERRAAVFILCIANLCAEGSPHEVVTVSGTGHSLSSGDLQTARTELVSSNRRRNVGAQNCNSGRTHRSAFEPCGYPDIRSSRVPAMFRHIAEIRRDFTDDLAIAVITKSTML